MARRGRRRSRRNNRTSKIDDGLMRSQAKVYFGGGLGGVVNETLVYEPDQTTFATKLKMRKDPVIALGLWTLKAPICVSDFTIQCEDRVIASFVDAQLRHLWPNLLRTSLKMLDFGWQPHETLWAIEDVRLQVKPRPEKGATEKPEIETVDLRKMAVLKGLKDINPNTVVPEYDVNKDEFVGVRQHQFGIHTKPVRIEKEKLYITTFDGEWGSVTGKSLLDNAYRPWYYSFLVEQLWARFMERRTIPPLVGTGPIGERIDAEGNATSNEDLMLTILNNIHHGNGAYLPNEPDSTTKQNAWSIDALQFFSQTDQFQTFLATMDGRCLRSMLIPEKTIIQGTKVGTLSETSQFTDTFMIGLDVILFDLTKMIQSQLVDRIVRLNFVNPPPCTIKVTQITSQRRASLTDLVTLLAEATDTNTHGVPYKFRDLIDFESVAAQIGVPTKDPEDILKRDEPDPDSVPSNGQGSASSSTSDRATASA